MHNYDELYEGSAVAPLNVKTTLNVKIAKNVIV